MNEITRMNVIPGMNHIIRSFAKALVPAAVGIFATASVTQATEPSPVAGRSFFADHKAVVAGDVLTVLITESASATETARTSTDKSDNANANLTNPSRGQRQWGVGLGSTFSGGGQLERSGKLLARLSVVVDRSDASGNLLVHGEQDIELNGEHQRIHLEGAVRPDDVGSDNTVPSWRIMNAKIALVGKGILGRAQSPGIIARILQWLHLE
jgi:flagellar L-ring protein precursor FlgH